MKQRIRAIAAAWFFCGAGIFSASSLAGPSLALEFPGNTGELFKAGYDDARITLDQGGDSPGKENLHVRAGLFHGSADVAKSGFDATSLFRDAGEVLAYCVDVLNLLSFYSEAYEVEDISTGQVDNRDGVRRDFGRMINFIGAVNTVLKDSYGFDFSSKNWLNPSHGWMSGAIQVGIWESLYEKENTHLSLTPAADGVNEWFSATGVIDDVIGDDGTFLTTAFGYVNSDINDDITVPVSSGELKLARIDGKQDLLLDPQQVPLPGTLLLLLGGLGSLLLRRQRAN